MNIDACMIVKNEARGIIRAIMPLLMNEDIRHVVVHDTGSTDRTLELLNKTAKKWPKLKVSQHEPIMWCTEEEQGFNHIDFAANRNRVKEDTDADWILSVDGDETVEFTKPLKEVIQQAVDEGASCIIMPVRILSMRRGAQINQHDSPQIRLFHRSCHWIQPIHNQLKPSGKVSDEDTGITITASYDPNDSEKDRMARSRRALQYWADENPDNVPIQAESRFHLCQFAQMAGDFAESERLCREWFDLAKHEDILPQTQAKGWVVGAMLIEMQVRRKDVSGAFENLCALRKQYPLDDSLHRIYVSFAIAEWVMAMEIGSEHPDGTSRNDPNALAKPIRRFVKNANLGWVNLIYEAQRQNLEEKTNDTDAA